MKSRFYDNGLRFECTGCGECCQYADAVVYVTEKEISAIAGYLSMSEAPFVLKYIGVFREKFVLKSNEDACIFLENNRCVVYPARPGQCRTFPFWPDILKSRKRWDLVSQSCEGMDRGKAFSVMDIRRIMKNEESVNGS